MTKKDIRIFNGTYLNILLSNDNATLIGEYDKLNGGVTIDFQCNCGKDANKLFRDISYYGGAYCKECIRKNKSKKIKDTCMKRYGCINPSQVDEIKQKKENTYMELYGMHPKKTEEVQNKYIATCLEKYGCINSGQATEIKYKIKEIFAEKYGGHPMYDEKIKQKVKDTCLEKYGCHPAQTDEIKQKVKKMFIEKYGCNPTQTPEVFEKIMKSSKSYKKYTMPSGEIRNVQGYEPFAINMLLKEYTEEEIKTNRKDVPSISYTFNNETKKYFPDIYIPAKNLIIEVKSDWIYNLDIDKNKVKEEFTKREGYNYEVWMFNKKGQRIN
jgi:hypothetical protein